MKIHKIFSKFSLRTISAALCISLVSSCAYESYPANSSYGGHSSSPYGNTRTVSDPTIPLILGASAIGALAYYGKKKHDARHDSRQYSRYDNRYNNRYNNRYSSHNNNHYRKPSRTTNHNVHYTSNDHRKNHYTKPNSKHSTRPSSNNDHNRKASREDYRNSARESLERKRDNQRDSQRSKHQTTRPDRTQVVSTSGSPRSSSGFRSASNDKGDRRSRDRD